jgi:N6-L-threonylcarbamoyladenine synthase
MGLIFLLIVVAIGSSLTSAMLPSSFFARRSCSRVHKRIDSSCCRHLSTASSANEAARAKRKAKIGLAKAIDRGLPNVVTYDPFRNTTFSALSGLPDRSPFLVLGIESSCDDTGAAVLSSDGKILGEALAKQNEIHQEWGGVVPGLARDAHVSNIDRVVETALANANLKSIDEVDAIAVTVGPGLEICLRVGCEKAYELAQRYNKPFVGVHHLEAHILMARLPAHENIDSTSTGRSVEEIDFPFLALLVSGGHCQLLECRGVGQYFIIGGTLDDSLGEAYDKTARLLGLPVGGGGGPAVEKLALIGDPKAVALSVPMQTRKDCDFSFAGLKSNVRRECEKLAAERGLERIEDLEETDKANIAASFQNVAIKHVEQRIKRAMQMMERQSIKTLAVVGGVAANQELRKRLQAICDEREWRMVVPPPRLCTDQGAYVLFMAAVREYFLTTFSSMSAWAGIERIRVGSTDIPSTNVYARYPFALIEREEIDFMDHRFS